ncbi:hypothetical protein BLNAU_3138 [Blattamonas nauphoetae]|uniref:Uncharacterized protein n=1 Tax=Blattamonas nauphoetae TaxID=2049346 RepID=A0ABQ9YDH4_9EUKA|nr:hypothetical protein BLNAU_3138 [Blattamonas nauphoetae]
MFCGRLRTQSPNSYSVVHFGFTLVLPSRLRTGKESILIGVCDTTEFPKYLTANAYSSPKAAMMANNGCIYTAKTNRGQNVVPQRWQEWSAEADLEKRTLHFFIDGVQQPHHFINIPVPLVFAIIPSVEGVQIEITYWGEEDRSHVTYQGEGHNLG